MKSGVVRIGATAALALAFASCETKTAFKQPITADLFEHHYIVTDLPGEHDWGYGTPALADFDGDGDLDIFSKVWNVWPGNGNAGREHGDFLENLSIR